MITFIIFLTGITYFPHGLAQLTINTGNETIFWEGCILQKRDMLTNETDFSDPCNKCAIARNKSLILIRKGFPQTMYNCTDYCPRVTICTHSWYISYPELKAARKASSSGSPKHHFFNYAKLGAKNLRQVSLTTTRYPLCYECQNWKNQHVKFNPVLEHQICSKDCWTCALWMDLSTSVFCLEDCKGYPTFCYPSNEKIGIHKKCYQSQAMFGCKQEEVPLSSISNPECRICVSLTRDEQDAKECAYLCGLPIHRKFINGIPTNIVVKCLPNKVYRPDLFTYEIPSFLLKFIHLNNPANLYGVENIQNLHQFSGSIANFVKYPFNMSLLTYPRPKGFESFTFLDTANTINPANHANRSRRVTQSKTKTVPNLAQEILDTYLNSAHTTTQAGPLTYTTDILQQLNPKNQTVT